MREYKMAQPPIEATTPACTVGRQLAGFCAVLLALCPSFVRADCSLTTTSHVPLTDLGSNLYQGFQGGLYPEGSNTPPAEHDAAGNAIAAEIVPLDPAGLPDEILGQIGFISVGMSNTTFEFASGGDGSFKPRADVDPSKNARVTIVDGAQGGKDAALWANPKDDAWDTLAQRISDGGLTPAQVQVVWMKQTLAFPVNYGAFPKHAQVLQADIEAILRNLKFRYPNLKIAYLSSRTRAYTEGDATLSPEPFAYEDGFAVQWVMADQINGNGNINFDSTKGPVVAPYVIWGPYLWADGTNLRSDQFTWLCTDVVSADYTHPSASGVTKVADQLLAFFKTDPKATPWFLRKDAPNSLTVTTNVTPSSGTADLIAQFTAAATDPGGTITSYTWTFDDGTFSYEQNPIKSFTTPGTYNVHLTVTDSSGGFVTTTVPITVGLADTALLNVSARLQVSTGDRVLIGGFIVNGSGKKNVMLRAIGPSLAPIGVSGALSDPFLELHDSTGATIATNDNWQTTQIGGVITSDQVAAINASTIAPVNPAESAIIASLDPGAYTAIVRGVNDGTGVGLAEVYDLDRPASAKVANLSTRGFAETDANVLIGGFIIGGPDSATVVVRALGPSLSQAGVTDALADPTLDLRDSNGVLMASDDNWADTQQIELELVGLAPSESREAAILRTLPPGNYTATVAGKNGGSGVGLVEIYKLQ